MSRGRPRSLRLPEAVLHGGAQRAPWLLHALRLGLRSREPVTVLQAGSRGEDSHLPSAAAKDWEKLHGVTRYVHATPNENGDARSVGL